MNLQSISLEPLHDQTVAILGYGNQGRAHALNLRDSGVNVLVGARASGRAEATAREDGFKVFPLVEAASQAQIVMLLLPDQEIPAVYARLSESIASPCVIGFAHGFAYHFGLIERRKDWRYFLVGPKGAGAILRSHFEKGEGLPAVFALSDPADSELRSLALAYAKGIGCAGSYLGESTFQQETEGDLFGEQAVLCGGVLQLMEAAYRTLVRNGHEPTSAFFDCCYETKLILELWMKYGPSGTSERISPTAFYGGVTRGRRLIDERTQTELEKMFQEVRHGSFAREWMEEVRNGMPVVKAARAEIKASDFERAYQEFPKDLK